MTRLSDETSIDLEQYNHELNEADTAIGQEEFYTREQAIERLSR